MLATIEWLCNSSLLDMLYFNFNGYWNCGSVGRSFWVATYTEPYFHFVETKPIINFLDVIENLVYTYAFTETLLSLVCLRMLPPPTIYMDVFKYAKPIWLDFLPLCL
jgi:hypothetical protein